MKEMIKQMIYTPIKINTRQYYFRNVYGGDGDYCYTQFYEKGDNIKVRKVKRKYWFFGPILSEKIEERENYLPVFKTGHRIEENHYFDIEAIKVREEKYFTWRNIQMGNLDL